MAFGERFMAAQANTKPAKAKAVTGTIAVILHGLALVFAIVWSFVHVEELPAPQVTVTFLAAAAPPPPPPPPPPPKRKSTPKTTPTQPTEIKQPDPNQVKMKEPEPEPEEEEDDGEEGGVEGGVKGGVQGGVVGGVVGGVKGGVLGGQLGSTTPVEEKPVFITPTMTQPTKIAGSPPVYPPEAKTARVQGDVVLKVCLSKTGAVQDIKVVAKQPMGLTEAAVAAVKGWRYAPYKVGGQAVAACLPLRLQFRLN